MGSWPRCLLHQLGVEVDKDLEYPRCYLELILVGQLLSKENFVIVQMQVGNAAALHMATPDSLPCPFLPYS